MKMLVVGEWGTEFRRKEVYLDLRLASSHEALGSVSIVGPARYPASKSVP